MDTRWILFAILLAIQSQAAGAECEAFADKTYADKLEACEPYECSYKHPFTGKPMIRKIVGMESDGNCLTHEQMPGNMRMECRFNEHFRTATAVFLRKVQTVKESSIKAKISGDKTEMTTRLDGEVVENPMQEAMDKGLCQIVMLGGKKEPLISSPSPDESLRHHPPKPLTPPIPSKKAAPASVSQTGTAPMPDLLVTEVKFDVRCRPIVTLENRGSEGLPATAYDRLNGAGVQLYKDGKGWQGVALFGFDRTKALMKPGGKATFTLFQPLPIDTPARVKIIADHRNQIRESTKENNTLEMELHCTEGNRKQ